MSSQSQSAGLYSEWSHSIDASLITHKSQSFTLQADEETRKALSRRLNVLGIESLDAKLDISLSAGRIYVSGHFDAKVKQACVVSTEEIESVLSEDFEAWFVDKDQTVSFSEAKKNQQSKKGHVEVEISEEEDDPEALVNGQIEAGDLVSQYLSLAIDPYPQKEGVHYENGDDAPQAEKGQDMRKSPFAALKDWKDKLE